MQVLAADIHWNALALFVSGWTGEVQMEANDLGNYRKNFNQLLVCTLQKRSKRCRVCLRVLSDRSVAYTQHVFFVVVHFLQLGRLGVKSLSRCIEVASEIAWRRNLAQAISDRWFWSALNAASLFPLASTNRGERKMHQGSIQTVAPL